MFKGRDIQGPRVTDRGPRDRSEDSLVEGKGDGESVNYCSSPILWQRPECTASRGVTDAFRNENMSTWNLLFQPPLCRLRAHGLIASRAFRFAFVDLFVDQDDSSFFSASGSKTTNCLQV